MIDVIEKETDALTILGHLTSGQRQRLDELDAAYIELLSSDSEAIKADIEALADAVVTLYDEIASGRLAVENPA